MGEFQRIIEPHAFKTEALSRLRADPFHHVQLLSSAGGSHLTEGAPHLDFEMWDVGEDRQTRVLNSLRRPQENATGDEASLARAFCCQTRLDVEDFPHARRH